MHLILEDILAYVVPDNLCKYDSNPKVFLHLTEHGQHSGFGMLESHVSSSHPVQC